MIAKEYISSTEAAMLAGVSVGMIRRKMAAGELLGRKLGARSWLVDRGSVEAYATKRVKKRNR
jgi:excisionase family DNA binding protein